MTNNVWVEAKLQKLNIYDRGRKQQGRLWLLRKSDSDTKVEWVLAESGCNSLVHPLGYIAQCNIIAMFEGKTLSCLHQSSTVHQEH